jgi:hypothetical protein
MQERWSDRVAIDCMFSSSLNPLFDLWNLCRSVLSLCFYLSGSAGVWVCRRLRLIDDA